MPVYYEWFCGFSIAIKRFVLYSYLSWAFEVSPKLALIEFAMIKVVVYVLEYCETNL
jgi:hypothetical protein